MTDNYPARRRAQQAFSLAVTAWCAVGMILILVLAWAGVLR